MSPQAGTIAPDPAPPRNGSDTIPELGSFDHYARLVRRSLGVPVGLVSIVEDYRQVFPGALGLPDPWQEERETPLTHSFCKYVVAEEKPLIIEDAREEPRLAENLAIPVLGVIAYAGWPITNSLGQVVGSLCAIDGEPRAWTVVDLENLSDLAAACSAEIAQRELVLASASLVSELERSNEHLETLGAQVSHDLQNPIGALSGTLELLEDEVAAETPDVDTVRMLLARSHRCVSRMSVLVRDVLRYAVVGGELTIREVDVADLVTSVLDDVPALAGVQVGVGELPSVNADALQLRLLLQNLLANVAKHAGGGPVEVQAHVDAGGDGESWVLEIVDHGRGIPPEARDRVFAAHERLDHSVPGSGLGLATCRRVVAAHHGTIGLDETPGGGTTVRVRLPRRAGLTAS
ncbi:sensor histidine kinase [Nocardioides dongxiaopingii]|uniref:sensor histidine kinase n=1 Tax=Nocardioides dongxiaopingii TaxID=2576036 RepID=UPI0010C76901|nr:GAF domain-containing sensor histidine kinase [Nocardioides dongxiaopingii]